MSQCTTNAQPWSEFSFILKPSPLRGIGVFATHALSAGTVLFSGTHKVRTLHVKDIPQEFIKYCVLVNDEECLCPERFDRIEIGWHLNHSSGPNIALMKQNADAIGSSTDSRMYVIKDIKAGEEILIDYNSLNEPEHLKEDYYKDS